MCSKDVVGDFGVVLQSLIGDCVTQTSRKSKDKNNSCAWLGRWDLNPHKASLSHGSHLGATSVPSVGDGLWLNVARVCILHILHSQEP